MGMMRVKDLRTGRIIETDNPYFQKVLFSQGSRYQTIPPDEVAVDYNYEPAPKKKTKKSDDPAPESEG